MKKSIQNIVMAAIAAVITTICIQKCGGDANQPKTIEYVVPEGVLVPDQLPNDTIHAIG